MEREIAAWNDAHRDAGVGTAPCLTCSRDYEACIVYRRLGETFASHGNPESEVDTAQADTSPQA